MSILETTAFVIMKDCEFFVGNLGESKTDPQMPGSKATLPSEDYPPAPAEAEASSAMGHPYRRLAWQGTPKQGARPLEDYMTLGFTV